MRLQPLKMITKRYRTIIFWFKKNLFLKKIFQEVLPLKKIFEKLKNKNF